MLIQPRQKYGDLTVVSELSERWGGEIVWTCKCVCGNITNVRAKSLRRGQTKSCGCGMRRSRAPEVTSVKLSAALKRRWQDPKLRAAIGAAISAANKGRTHTETTRATLAEKATKHGYARSDDPNIKATYRAWSAMKQRCLNRNSKFYHDYGGRGINVTTRWLGVDGFLNFVTDLGIRPSPDHELDRKNNNGNYTPSNCRWVTKRINANNKRNNVMVSCNGERKTLAQWADAAGLSYETLRWRYNNGWRGAKATSPRTSPLLAYIPYHATDSSPHSQTYA